MTVKTKNGVIFTDDMFENLAKSYESGEWPGKPTGEIIRGRPRIAPEDSKTVTFKLPISKIMALDKIAESCGGTRSEALRQAVDGFLKQA
ncbi:MAG: ribbon-helix-helix domain-containing protein [Firmicutes bacterium]|nr:ribbon-helix-helix domain-containing protein [Bacillota bacterium]